MVTVVLVIGGFAVLCLYLWDRRQRLKLETIRKALEDGYDVSSQLDRLVGTDLRRGIRLLGRAFAYITVGVAIGMNPPRPEDANDAISVMWILIGVSAFPGFLGISAIGLHLFARHSGKP